MTKTNIEGGRLLDVKAAGAFLGVSAWTIRELTWSGKIPFVRVGRLIRLDIRDLELFIAQNKSIAGQPFDKRQQMLPCK